MGKIGSFIDSSLRLTMRKKPDTLSPESPHLCGLHHTMYVCIESGEEVQAGIGGNEFVTPTLRRGDVPRSKEYSFEGASKPPGRALVDNPWRTSTRSTGSSSRRGGCPRPGTDAVRIYVLRRGAGRYHRPDGHQRTTEYLLQHGNPIRRRTGVRTLLPYSRPDPAHLPDPVRNCGGVVAGLPRRPTRGKERSDSRHAEDYPLANKGTRSHPCKHH